jgi:ArsR family transcriptional regulator, zinc-responsive transcriptional repressor
MSLILTLKDPANVAIIKAMAQIVRSLNNPIRVKIINLLMERGRMNVTQIYSFLNMDQSYCSQHLAILRRQGILIGDYEGKERFYSVDETRLDYILSLGRDLMETTRKYSTIIK